jgi:hypothetical protein
MGANSTQALGIVVFLLAFVCLSAAMGGGGILALVGFVVLLAASVFLFLKCKPWEHQE